MEKSNKVVKKQSLEDVLGSKNKIKLLRFLAENNDWQFNLASISSRIGMDKGALSRVVKELEEMKVLEIKRQGKLLLFRLNTKNKLISNLIIPFFEKEGRLQ